MEDSLHNTGSSGGFMQNMTTKNLFFVFSGVFLFVALMSGLYLSTENQNIAPRAEVPSSCQGENVYVADNCGGDSIVGSIPGSGLAGAPGSTASQLCCQRQSAPPSNETPKDVVPTEAPAPTTAPETPNVPPTDKPTDPDPTSGPSATNAPVATEAPAPTTGPSCRQAPDFDVEIIINECPGCLGATTQ